MSFDFTPSAIPEVVKISSAVHRDERGGLVERYRKEAFEAAGIHADFVQENASMSHRRVLRGLHYQLPPHVQGKLVWVAAGTIFDVAVDLRRESPTFGQWVSAELDSDGGSALWIPPGFAHGYQVLSDRAAVVYKLTASYRGESGRGVRWNDPRLGIDWPLADPILSEKDRAQPLLADAELPDAVG